MRSLDNTLIKNLQGSAKLLETHISWVLLTGEYAYKIKKPVDFGFMDYSTLEKRHFYCLEEIHLNQQFAKELYLEVVTINGDIEQPSFNGTGPILDYAVKMREFSQQDLFSALLANDQLTVTEIDALAKMVAEFHLQTPVAAVTSRFGTPEHVHAPVLQNFEQILPLLTEEADIAQLQRLEALSAQHFQQHYSLLQQRKNAGFIRDCHGDLHLGNIVLYQQQPLLFDRIEFNDDLRWTDVMADLAFLTMDLEDYGQTHFARRLLNHYLQLSGDYAGLAVLPYYQAYRAIVRAKITLFGINAENETASWKKYRRFMSLAERLFHTPKQALFITHGFSASGKSQVARVLAEQFGFIHISSDIERKRLFGLAALAKTQSAAYQGIYHSEATTKTYQQLATTAAIILAASYPVVVDATFLMAEQRQLLQQLAAEWKIPFTILACEAEPAELTARIQYRQTKLQDPSEGTQEILMQQMAVAEPLLVAEQKYLFTIDTQTMTAERLVQELQQKGVVGF